jgi:uncharacterized membrane protein YgcG
MNQGLEILIARTKTHPQEFFGWETGSHIASRWVTMMENFTNHMTEEEKFAWEEAKVGLNEWYANKRRDDFTEAVMKELLVRESGEEVRDDGVALNSMKHPTKLITAASLTHEALTILAGGGGGGGGNYPQGGGYGGGGSSYAGSGGSVVVKTPTGTHTFTKSGTAVVNGDGETLWSAKP